MIILGIETSCDETAAAVVQNGTKILSNIVASSADMHAKTGGIIPEQAARQQIKSIIPVIQEALSSAFPKTPTTNYHLLSTKIDAITVTIGPGLIGSLLVGIETAKTLSFLWKKPIVPVNHLIGHIYANWLTPPPAIDHRPLTIDHQLPQFPALALVVSGGHTDLVLMKDHAAPASATRKRCGRGNIKWIGGTRDDAAGEAFDKTARLLGLSYPGGPAIAKEADKFLNKSSTISHRPLNLFPRPMIDEDNFDWSFSGLKTSVLRKIENKKLTLKKRQKYAAEIQEAIVDSLVTKSMRAIKKFKPKSFLIAGGVAANSHLCESLQNSVENYKTFSFHVPPAKLCTDNAAYIASCAYFNYHPIGWKKIKANPQLTIVEKYNS